MPGILISVDPGIRGCGVALFDGGKLVRAAYVKSPAKTGNNAAACVSMGLAVYSWTDRTAPDALALEWPQVYASRIREGSSKADPNDLLALCGVDSVIAALYDLPTAMVTCFAPAEWKGQMSKEACQGRIIGRLSAAELEIVMSVSPPSLRHNVFDAVGIGLFRLGRFDRVRVIA